MAQTGGRMPMEIIPPQFPSKRKEDRKHYCSLLGIISLLTCSIYTYGRKSISELHPKKPTQNPTASDEGNYTMYEWNELSLVLLGF
jgi:hypothetical protein